jgi:pimeloyl-ACP methyl ester carboxylesterase
VLPFPTPRSIEVSTTAGGERVTLAVHELSPQGDGPGHAVVFCHGFPDLAFGWRHQLPVVAAAGYRAIAPDQRGYGASSAPDAVSEFGIAELTGDLVGMLDALDIERAIFVGHDWGGFVAWAMPVLHPDRVIAVAGLCTPYMPFPSIAKHLAVVGGEVDRQYVAWFQTQGVAESVMNRKVQPILTRIFRGGVPLEVSVKHALADGRLNMNPFNDPEGWPVLGEPLCEPDDLDVYFKAYEAAGFRGGINWYRNIDRNAAEHPDIGLRALDIPCLMLTSEWDPGLRPEFAEVMRDRCTDLELHLVERAGHWIQQEWPDIVNRHLLGWLERVSSSIE